MHVDVSNPAHLLVRTVISSSDWFWFQYYTGAKIVIQRHTYPACLCPNYVPGVDENGQCIAPAPATTARFKV
jgi:hypothetical protein